MLDVLNDVLWGYVRLARDAHQRRRRVRRRALAREQGSPARGRP